MTDTAYRRLSDSKTTAKPQQPPPRMCHARARVRVASASTGFGAGIVPSLDEEAMEYDTVMTTERPVLIADPYLGYEPIEEVLLARGGRFPKRMPLLDSHARGSVANILGGASQFRREGTDWIGRCSHTHGVQASIDAFCMVAAGHLTDVSVGYEVSECYEIPPGRSEMVAGQMWEAGDYPLRISTKWYVRELSLTPIGADDEAKIRHQNAAQSAHIRAKYEEEYQRLWWKMARAIKRGASPTGKVVTSISNEMARIRRLQHSAVRALS